MILLVVCWTALFYLCVCLGAVIVGRQSFLVRISREDSFMLSLWIGLAALALALLAVSLAAPLSTAVGAAMFVAVTAAACAAPSARRFLIPLLKRLSWYSLASALLLTAVTGLLAIQIVSNRDAISYQFDIVTWLSRAGTVPGMALVHSRFGFVSSWFAPPAIFNHGFMVDRVATVGNGFILLLALVHIFLAGRRILRNEGMPTDFFVVLALPAALVVPLLLNVQLSPSPDFAVTIFTVVTVWSMAVLLDEKKAAAIPLLLGAGAATFKLTALPLLFVTALYFWRARGLGFSPALLAVALSALVLMPVAAASVVASGHLLYPLPLSLDLPWTLTPDAVVKELKPIFTGARFTSGHDFGYLSGEWLVHWLNVNKEHVAGFLFIGLSTMALVWMFLCRRDAAVRNWFVPAAGCGGLAFLIAFSPQPRFGWGYLSVTFCALALVYGEDLREPMKALSDKSLPFHGDSILPLVFIVLFTVPSNLLFSTASERRIRESIREGTVSLKENRAFLLPPEIPSIRYDDDRDFAYEHRGFTAEGRPSPGKLRGLFYSPGERPQVCYRYPEEGMYGGYMRCSGRKQ